MPTDNDFTKILDWPGYRVYRQEINEKDKTLKIWVRRKRGNRVLRCPSCGRRVEDIHEIYERAVRDLPCFEYQTTVIIELYRIRCCPDCGVKAEKVAPLPSKAPYSKRFEDAVGEACESASARQVARRMRLAESTVRAIDLRYLERWEVKRRKPPLRQMGVDEIYKGKKDKFLTVVCNLETGEPLWFGKDRKKETLVEIGPGVEGFSIGDNVFAMADDTYAELRVVKASVLAKVPTGLDLNRAAALPLATTTGNQLSSATGIKAGQTILVVGAIGSVGRSAVFTAKVRGATVIAGVLKKPSSGEFVGDFGWDVGLEVHRSRC